MKKINAAERLEFHRSVWGGDDPEVVYLKLYIASLREALGDIAVGVHGLGVLSKDNMRRRAIEALR